MLLNAAKETRVTALPNMTEDCNLNYVFQIISDITGVDIIFLILHMSIANERIFL